jgi:hypothetical protein
MAVALPDERVVRSRSDMLRGVENRARVRVEVGVVV